MLAVAEGSLEIQELPGYATVTVGNTGGEALRFRVLSDKQWLTAEPALGEIAPGQIVELGVQVDALGAGERGGSLAIVSTGGAFTLPVLIPRRLGGLYRGRVTFTTPLDIGTRALGVYLQQSADGTLTGVVDDAGSPVFPYRAALSPQSRVSESTIEMDFVIPSPYGSRSNPDYSQDLQRRVTITAAFTATDRIAGTLEERIAGMFEDEVVLSGPFELVRIGAPPPPPPQYGELLPAPAPIEPPFPSSCTTCPSGAACSGDDLVDGQEFLTAAFPLYDAFRASDYAAVKACVDGLATCFNAAALECAQAYFYRAWKNDPNATCTAATGGTIERCPERGLLDTFKGLYAWHMLAGNEMLVRAHLLKPITPLSKQEEALAASEVLFRKSVSSDVSTAPATRAMLDPFFVRWIASLPPASFAARLSLLPEHLKGSDLVAVYTVPAYGDLARAGAAAGRYLAATLHALRARHRLAAGDATGALWQAERAAVSAHVSLALIAGLAQRVGASVDLSEASAAASSLTGSAREIADGLNPVGLPDGFIAYTYNPASGPASNNFLEQYERFLGTTGSLQRAKSSQQQAETYSRLFESAADDLARELNDTARHHAERLMAMCGGTVDAPAISTCGEASGEIFEAKLEVREAVQRIELAAQAISRVYSEIEIEQNRAAAEAGLARAQAELVLADGKRLAVLSEREKYIRDAQAIAQGGMAVAGAIGGGPWAMAAAAAAGAANVVATHLLSDIAAEREQLAIKERASVQFDAAVLAESNSAAVIKRMLLEIPMLKINAQLAALDMTRAVSRLRTASQAVVDAEAGRRKALLLLDVDARRDPAFRAYRDHYQAQALEDFDVVLRDLFLLARSLEYELNFSYAKRGLAFSLASPDEAEIYAHDLERTYREFSSRFAAPQARVVSISLRDDIYRLGRELTDATTGTEYTRQERFRRFVAEPRNRNGQGNLQLAFTLSLGADTTIFNPTFCNARIRGIGVSLVGAALGARQPEVGLAQRGMAYLRSCTDKDDSGAYRICEYGLENTLGQRVSIIAAGVNLSGPNDPNAPPLNVELYGRPVAAHYELFIDRSAPQNATLDVGQLDDIVLFLSYETRTIQ